MRIIKFDEVVREVEKLCIDCCHDLPLDVVAALEDSLDKETNPKAQRIIKLLLENARLAREELIPICQDTGLAIVFVEQGNEVFVESSENESGLSLSDAINEGVKSGYEKGLLRKSVVSEPLNKRKNTNTNTPAVIHHSFVAGDELKITVMSKGGGCENKSQFKMFNPTEKKEVIMDWIKSVVVEAGANACPPFVVGVGIGGDFEQCCFLSKKALLRNLNESNDDPFYGKMEEDILALINSTGLGPQGLGGDTTALGVKIEIAPCHIASLPVAVNIECHAHRHKAVVI